MSTLIIFTLVEVMCILRGEKIEEVQKRRMRLKQRDAAYRSRYSGNDYRKVRGTGYASSSERRRAQDSSGYRRSAYAETERRSYYRGGSSYEDRYERSKAVRRTAGENLYAQNGRYASSGAGRRSSVRASGTSDNEEFYDD